MNDSTPWITVANLPAELNAELLAMELDRYRIEYQIAQQNDERLLLVSQQEAVPTAVAVLQQYQQMALQQQHPERPVKGSQGSDASLLQQALQTPVVLITLVLGLLGAVLVSFLPELLHWFTFQDFEHIDKTHGRIFPADLAFGRGEYWRLLTPAFLHFGPWHIIFNGLWTWEFGRRIELLVGKSNFILIALGIAIAANVGQYWWEPNQIFGGLSGLVYGLLGYVWVRNMIAPHPLLRVPPGIIGLMLAWLVICALGIVDLFLDGGVANSAHVVGLLTGMLFGGVAGLGNKGRENV
ncbi:MAG: rhomboid family intramembrane serine protease [Porticoccaceae bacterium]